MGDADAVGLLNSTEVVRVATARQLSDLYDAEGNEKPDAFFSPLFTHQIYADERIEGHTKPVVDVVYHASDLSLAVVIKPDPISGAPAITDLATPMQGVVVCPHAPSVELMLEKANARFTPPGEKVHEYTPAQLDPRAHSQGDHNQDARVFEVYRGSFKDEKFVAFHRRMQLLNILFIDGASYIDEADERWVVFTLFEKREDGGDTQYTFVGFATTYHFFAYPDNTRPRISQFFLLPAFHGKGHAVCLLRAVYGQCMLDKQCLEVLVEDPTPAFQKVRLLVEMLICHERKAFVFEGKGKQQLTKERLAELTKQVHLGKRSLRRVHEVFLQRHLGPAPTEAVLQDFRLGVKARLYREHEDELEGMEAADRKQKLADLYEAARVANAALIDRFERLV